MPLQEFIDLYTPEIEAELARNVELAKDPHYAESVTHCVMHADQNRRLRVVVTISREHGHRP